MTAVARCKFTRSRLSEGRSADVEVIEIANGALRLFLLPQRGMGIWKVFLGDIEFGWQSPVTGPVHPMLVPIQDGSGLGWLEGFDELLCRCGLQSFGPPVFDPNGRLVYPLHGRIANLPAEAIEIRHDDATGQLDLVGVVREARFHQFNLRLTSTLTIRPGEQSFSVRDEITNLSHAPADCQLLYHYNIGLPLLGEGAEVVAPIRELAPRDARAAEGIAEWASIGPPVAGYAEQVFYSMLHADADGTTQVMLKGPDGQIGTGLQFNIHQLPCFIVWKNAVDARDGYVVGIEPGTGFANPRPFEVEQGRVVALGSGESKHFDVRFEFYGDRKQVRTAEQQIEALQRAAVPIVFSQPRSGWSPGALPATSRLRSGEVQGTPSLTGSRSSASERHE